MIRFLTLLCLLVFSATTHAADPTHFLIVVGPTNHPPGTHEVAATAKLMAYCLEHAENVSDVKVTVVTEWPDESQRQSADTIIFSGDTFPPHRMGQTQQKLDDLRVMMDRGCGIVCVHYATGILGTDVGKDGDHPLLRWMGGYFANKTCAHHQGIARVFKAAKIEPVSGKHPVLKGWQPFTLHDEPYINNYFGPDNNHPAENVTILATSMLPPEAPKAEPVAWCVQRPDGGRGFAIVMPHFYKNWSDDDLRTFILNGVVWSARCEVPDVGVKSALPDLTQFEPASVNVVPKRPN